MVKKSFLLLSLLFLCSCIEMEQEIWINGNGSGRVRIVFGVTKGLYQLVNMKSAEDKAQQAVKDQELLLSNQNVTKATIEEFVRNDLQFYSIDVEVKDLKDTKQLEQDLQTILSFGDGKQIAQPEIIVEKQGLGEYSFVYKFDDKKEAYPNVDRVFADRKFTFRLHVPHVISSNGKKNKEHNMVEWQFPMADIIGKKGSFLPELKAEIRIVSYELLLFIIFSVIAIVLGVVYGIYRKLKKT